MLNRVWAIPVVVLSWLAIGCSGAAITAEPTESVDPAALNALGGAFCEATIVCVDSTDSNTTTYTERLPPCDTPYPGQPSSCACYTETDPRFHPACDKLCAKINDGKTPYSADCKAAGPYWDA
jgi:hypothetical protein